MSAQGVAIADHCAIVHLLRVVTWLSRNLFCAAGSFGLGAPNPYNLSGKYPLARNQYTNNSPEFFSCIRAGANTGALRRPRKCAACGLCFWMPEPSWQASLDHVGARSVAHARVNLLLSKLLQCKYLMYCIFSCPELPSLGGDKPRCLGWIYKLPGRQKFCIKLSPLFVGFPQRKPLDLIKRRQFINSPGVRFINHPPCNL